MPEPTRRDLILATLAGGALTAMRPASAVNSALSAPSQTDARLDWFLNAKFGLFMHWGPYSIAGVEASWPIMVPGLTALLGPDQRIDEADYVDLAKSFDPREYRPDEWVATARRCGMRYLVITAKHHDGYCLFDAPGTNYKSTVGARGRDLIGELAEACARDGMPLGLYYSPPDMHHPGYRDTSKPVAQNWIGEPERPQWSEYVDTMEAQLETLLTKYGDIAVLWFDGLFEHDRYQPERLLARVHELQPRCLINDRLGAKYADYVTPEQAVPSGIPVRRERPATEISAEQLRAVMEMIASGTEPEAFARLLEQSVRSRFPTERYPEQARFQPWETCLTVGATWSFDPKHRALKSAEQLLGTLIDVVSGGGNLLLNIGPTPEGTLPEPETQRALKVGAWLERFGEAIYETTYGPFQGLEGVRSTSARSGANRDYLIALEPAADGSVQIQTENAPSAATKLLNAERLRRVDDQIPVELSREAGGLRLAPSRRPAGRGSESAAPADSKREPTVFSLDSGQESAEETEQAEDAEE